MKMKERKWRRNKTNMRETSHRNNGHQTNDKQKIYNKLQIQLQIQLQQTPHPQQARQSKHEIFKRWDVCYGAIRCNRRRRVRWEQRATTGKARKQTTTGKLDGRMRSVAMYSTSSSKNNDNNTGRGEQVTGHYLPGAGTNYERKKYRKVYIKLHEKLLKFRRTCQKESTSKFEQPRIEAR